MGIGYRKRSSLFLGCLLKLYEGADSHAGHIIHAAKEEYQVNETSVYHSPRASLKVLGAVKIDLPFGLQYQAIINSLHLLERDRKEVAGVFVKKPGRMSLLLISGLFGQAPFSGYRLEKLRYRKPQIAMAADTGRHWRQY